MFKWLKGSIQQTKISSYLIQELNMHRPPERQVVLQASLYNMQLAVVRTFGSIEGYLLSDESKQQDYLNWFDHMAEQLDLFGSVIEEDKLGILAMYSYLAGIRRGYTSQSRRLGDAMFKHVLHPDFFKKG